MKVLLVVVDSLRADAITAQTPTLNHLAKTGFTPSQSFCSASWTIPSLVSMTTGCLPHRMGVCNWRHPLPNRPTLFTRFADAGAAVSVFTPNPHWAFSGWAGIHQTGDSQNLADVEGMLREPGDRLVVVHHWRTHFPYVIEPRHWQGLRHASEISLEAFARSPQRMAPRFSRLYARSVHHFSEVVLPRWLDALTGQQAIVAITGDHGESWGDALPPGRSIEHIFDLHGRWMTDETTAVPLLFWGPAISPGRPSGFARGVDVAPTLCALAGLPSLPEDTDGHDLTTATPADHALTISSHNTLFPESYPDDGALMWRGWSLRSATGRWTWDAPTDHWSSPPPKAVRDRILAAHQHANGPRARFQQPPTKPDVTGLHQQMRMLGYAD